MNLQGKRVFVTGAEGFIGSHLTELLVEKGAEVTCLVQYNSFNNWGWLETLPQSIKKDLKIVTGDIREYDGISKCVKGKEIVFHLAALIAIPYSYQSPMAYVRTNVEGTTNVLEASRNFDISKVIHTSTSEVYGTAEYIPIDEKHPLKGQSPYSASKIGADKIAESYFNSYGVPISIARPFNTFGPRQSARAIIPTIISQIVTGKKSIELGDLSPTRDFNFVKDTVRGMCAIAESEKTIGETINIGTGNEISMKDLVQKIIQCSGKEIIVKQDELRLRPTNSEVMRLIASNDKIKRLTSWTPKYTLQEGLMETMQWIEDNIQYYKTDIYNV